MFTQDSEGCQSILKLKSVDSEIQIYRHNPSKKQHIEKGKVHFSTFIVTDSNGRKKSGI